MVQRIAHHMDREMVAGKDVAPEVIAAAHLVAILAGTEDLDTLALTAGELLELAKLAWTLADEAHKYPERLREIAEEAIKAALPYSVLEAVGRAVAKERPHLWPVLCWAIAQSPTLVETWRDTYAPTLAELRELSAFDPAAAAVLRASTRGDAALRRTDGEG